MTTESLVIGVFGTHSKSLSEWIRSLASLEVVSFSSTDELYEIAGKLGLLIITDPDVELSLLGWPYTIPVLAYGFVPDEGGVVASLCPVVMPGPPKNDLHMTKLIQQLLEGIFDDSPG